MDAQNMRECQKAIYSQEYGDLIVDMFRDIEDLAENFNITCLQIVEGQFQIAHAPNVNNISVDIVRNGYRSIPKLYGLMDTTNIEDTGIYRLRRLPYLDLLGQGTLVGVIDTGIDFENPLFINADNTSRIRGIWDQTIQTGKPPEDIIYGSEYTKEDLDRALQNPNPSSIVPTIDENGHGTFLAGIMAGNEDLTNDFTGIVPQAEIVVVKLKPAKQYLRDFYGIKEDAIAFQENDIMMGIKYLYDQSIKYSKPISICIGLGTSSGDHDGSSPLSSYLDSLANFTGVCISTAAGNEGTADNHYTGDVAYNTFEDVEINVGENDKNLTMELWSLTPSLFSVAVISPSGELAEKIPAKANLSVKVTFVLEPTQINVTYGITDAATGNEVIILQFRDLVPGIWRIRVYNEYTVGTTYNIWMPISQFVSEDTKFLLPNPYITLVETGTTSKVISTTAYNHTNNSLYLDSSRGYTLTGRIKPEIASPGVNIYGPIGRDQFGTKTGTSVAAAHTAGIGAIFLQWGIVDKNSISINTSEIKALLIKGATRADRTYPNRDWGYGTINAYQAFESLRTRV